MSESFALDEDELIRVLRVFGTVLSCSSLATGGSGGPAAGAASFGVGAEEDSSLGPTLGSVGGGTEVEESGRLRI